MEHLTQSALWARVPFLADVGDEPIAALAAVATRHVYDQGQTIFLEGEPVAGLYLVDEGVVKICRYALDGREHILAVVGLGLGVAAGVRIAYRSAQRCQI